MGWIQQLQLPIWLCLASVNITAAAELTIHLASDGCLVPGDELIVSLTVAQLDQPINGLQAIIAFDPTMVTPIGASIAAADSPWHAAIEIIEQTAGDSFVYALMLPMTSTSADATAADIIFRILSPGTTAIDFAPPTPPMVTKLTAFPSSHTIVPATHGTGPITITHLGDHDHDNDIDFADVAGFQLCFTGPHTPADPPIYPDAPAPCCPAADFDHDGDVDLVDFVEFLSALEMDHQ